MNVSGLDNALWICAAIGQFLLIFILWKYRLARAFPVFTTYIAWLAISDPLLMLIVTSNHPAISSSYKPAYYSCTIVQYLLELCVLAEIANNVLRPAKRSFSKRLLLFWGIATILVATGAFFFAVHVTNAATFSHPRTASVDDSTVAILRLAMFILIAAFAQVLGLNWKNHVLQLASGFAFYAVITLIVEIGQSRLNVGSADYALNYYSLQRLEMGGYLCTLFFWCYAFAKKEAPRKEFSPQMVKILVSLSGSTKRQRSALARSRDQ